MMRPRPAAMYQWLNRHPLLTFLMISTFLVSAGYWRLTEIIQCGQDYAARTNAASAPVREARIQKDAADDLVWEAANKVLTQRATSVDYDLLRSAVRARDLLSGELRETQRQHPIPPPPENFC